VAQNKLVSAAASTVVKAEGRAAPHHRPSSSLALLDVHPGNESTFLAPESVTLLPDLDDRIRSRLDDYQLELMGEIQVISDQDLCTVFGPMGATLGAQSRGIDPRPVLPPAVRAEFRATHTLGDDSNDLSLLHRVLRHLTERLGARLRARNLVARRLTLKLAYTDYATGKRSVPLPRAALDQDLWEAARRALELARQRTVALRAMGIVVDRLLEADLQLKLWETDVTSSGFRVPSSLWPDRLEGGRSSVLGTRNPEPGTSLQSAVDQIRRRWGAKGVRLGGQ